MTGRVGIFFVFLGLTSMWVYFATDFSKRPVFLLFIAALVMIIVGISLIRKDYSPPPPSNRFRLLRRMRKKDAKDKKDES
jgi:hypothetical protein